MKKFVPTSQSSKILAFVQYVVDIITKQTDMVCFFSFYFLLGQFYLKSCFPLELHDIFSTLFRGFEPLNYRHLASIFFLWWWYILPECCTMFRKHVGLLPTDIYNPFPPCPELLQQKMSPDIDSCLLRQEITLAEPILVHFLFQNI